MAERRPAGEEVTIVANDIGGVGGMERQLTELITGLLAEGTLVTVISWSCSLPAHSNLRWVRVWGPSRPFTIANPWFIVVASLLVLLRGRGIVHSTGAIVLNATDVCTVHFCHAAVADLPHFSRASREGRFFRVNSILSKAMSRLAERWCYRPGRARRLVGVSLGVARELRKHYPAMRDCIEVIPNGVDTRVFQPSEEKPATAPARHLRALFVGSEWERKGLQFAIEALDGKPDIELTVVGEGDVDAYRRLVAQVGAEERVHFAGLTEDVVSFFQHSDAFVLPTAYETFSLVTYEAAASGLPLLVTRVNGVEDLLRDGENGWFVERDADDLASKLCALRDDEALRRRMGECARRDSAAFSWERVVATYRELYKGLADPS